jgi:hypothetical protein
MIPEVRESAAQRVNAAIDGSPAETQAQARPSPLPGGSRSGQPTVTQPESAPAPPKTTLIKGWNAINIGQSEYIEFVLNRDASVDFQCQAADGKKFDFYLFSYEDYKHLIGYTYGEHGLDRSRDLKPLLEKSGQNRRELMGQPVPRGRWVAVVENGNVNRPPCAIRVFTQIAAR